MIALTLNGANVDPSNESEINRIVNRARTQDAAVCVSLRFQTFDVDLFLVTDACKSGGGGGRPPNAREAAIIDLWTRHQLQSGRFPSGQLIAFLKKLT